MDEELHARLRRWLRAESAPAAAVALAYLAFGTIWIVASDRAVAALVADPAQLTVVQTYKGWAFVLTTSLFLFIIVWAAFKLRTIHVETEAEVNRFLGTLLRNVPGMAYRCRNDTEWSMEYVSQGVAPLTGYSSADFIENGRITWAELIEPEDRERVWEEVQEALERRGPFRLEYRIRSRGGQRKWVWEQGRGVYAPDGDLVALEGYLADITARKEAEAEASQRFARAPRPPRNGSGRAAPERAPGTRAPRATPEQVDALPEPREAAGS